VEEVTVVDRDENSQVVRTILGAAIYIGELGEPWKIVAPEGGEARVDSPDSDITAQVIVLHPRRKIVDAEGEIKVILKLRKDEPEAVGFFSNEEPVFITAQGMRYETAANRLTLRKGVRMWQGKEMLFAETLTLLKKTGEILGQGKVRSLFSHRPKKEEQREEKIEIGGEKLSFNPGDSRLVYEEECWLKMPRVNLRSGMIAVALREKKAEILTISAKDKVTITEELREGWGEAALYDLEEETVILTGNPTIVDKDKGVVEGDKLTFRLGDGRIQVENKERDRSATVIKS
jgi:lipopolysaccharide export system protein LptA